MSTKGIYVVSFAKENPENQLVNLNNDAVILPGEMPTIDMTIKGGDQIQASTEKGKVTTVTRNGRKIPKHLVPGKVREIEEKEKEEKQKGNER